METNAIFISAQKPALVLAPMEGVTDAPMRALLTGRGGFDYCVSEFFRISQDVASIQAFKKHIPELKTEAKTSSGVPVQVQLLGGNPERLAESAQNAVRAGATGIDLNFGCPAPTVNRHDGGATLLKYPKRIATIVASVRQALPPHIPVSAKLRLGWENPADIYENAAQAAEAGASWITIHARTKTQGYIPPAYWQYIGQVKRQLSIPVIANGDIWSLDDLIRCQEETGCIHFMIGRGAMANPALPMQLARYLKTGEKEKSKFTHSAQEWKPILEQFSNLCEPMMQNSNYPACRIKKWLSMAANRNSIHWIGAVRQSQSLKDIFSTLDNVAEFKTSV